MTANEIRARARLTSERSAFARYEQADWLAEIAAQLAELNQHLSATPTDILMAERAKAREAIMTYGPLDANGRRIRPEPESDLNPFGHVHGCSCGRCLDTETQLMNKHRESCAECQSALDEERAR